MTTMRRRQRRLRASPHLRKLVQEHQIGIQDLIQPLFIEEQITTNKPIDALPGLVRYAEQNVAQEVRELYELGIRYVMPFGISHTKDSQGSDTWDEHGLLARMIRAIKQACPDIVVIPDICFCEYTTHGHCGVIHQDDVDNDATLENLAKQAVTAAKAGADILAPSTMMDGQTQAIRQALDQTGYHHVGILAHSMKYASAFYGPFRQAVDCELSGDRKTYQANPTNGREALIEASMDEQEGADILMVKPGTPYLDIVHRIRENTNLPVAVYQVSGEYAILQHAIEAGLVDERQSVMETMLGFKRAGADIVVTYFARRVAQWLQKDNDVSH